MQKLIKSISIAVLMLLMQGTAQAQRPLPDAKKVQFGYLLYANYNLYQWYQKPTFLRANFRSSGQILNVLPGLGLGLWVGKPKKWILSLEGGGEFAPFTLDINKFKGMGSIAVPALIKCSLPFSKQQSALFAINFGAGAQWTWSEIYAVPTEFKYGPTLNTFFVTYIAEIGLSMGALGENLKRVRDFSFYARLGANVNGAITFNAGLRVGFWNGLLK
ncbi:MAG: hypothetical protein GY810_30985 [Aureispira sp.]|nr:hypothetical protein [Aureispira sp.]